MWCQLPRQMSLRCLVALWHGLDHIVMRTLRRRHEGLLRARCFFSSNFLRVVIRADWVLGRSGLRSRLDWAQIWIPRDLDYLCLARVDVLSVAFESHEHNGEIVQRSIPSSSVEDLVSNESTDCVHGRSWCYLFCADIKERFRIKLLKLQNIKYFGLLHLMEHINYFHFG